MSRNSCPESVFAILITIFLLSATLLSTLPISALRYGLNFDIGKADAIYSGEFANDWSGFSVAALGDVNGDGIDDILVGAPMFKNDINLEAGKAYLIYGSKDISKTKNINVANASFLGNGGYRHAGFSVSGAGDVNGDGYADYLIGMPDSTGANPSPGYAGLFFGGNNRWGANTSLADADVYFKGELTDDKAGFSVAGVGDLDADGYDDIMIVARDNGDQLSGAGKAYLFYGRALGWPFDANDMVKLKDANATFLGENSGDMLSLVGPAGDTNKDGYDDFLIAAPNAKRGGSNSAAGVVYIFRGNPNRLNGTIDLSKASLLIQGTDPNQRVGTCAVGVGDFDKNSYDDLVVCSKAPGASGATYVYRAYLFLNSIVGFTSPADPKSANNSFVEGGFGAAEGITTAAFTGDVNGDGYADFILGDKTADNLIPDAGRAFLITGTNNLPLKENPVNTTSAASFVGQFSNDNAGSALGGGGDFDLDGYYDSLVGAYLNDGYLGTKPNSGRTYVILPDHNMGPNPVVSVRLCGDQACTTVIDHAAIRDTVYIELSGGWGNATRKDIALVKVHTSKANPVGIVVPLLETGVNTGLYRGSVKIENRTREEHSWIKAVGNETLMAIAVNNTQKMASLFVLGDFKIKPISDVKVATEDQPYLAHYWAEGIAANFVWWNFSSNATWLNFISPAHNLTGTPTNAHVGQFSVNVSISNKYGQKDKHNFTLTVKNVPPKIMTPVSTLATEDVLYKSDHNSSDDGQGVITWHLATNASWLKMNATSGLLSGTPGDYDLGKFWANASVDDNNGGWDYKNFTITVSNTQDAPNITTVSPSMIFEDRFLEIQFEALDPDPGDSVTWSMSTNASSWLKFNPNNSTLYGMPDDPDVGEHLVNITAKDSTGLSDSHRFVLTVLNINEPPVITSTPPKTATALLKYTYQVKVTDPDPRDVLTYSLDQNPQGMRIDSKTGLVTWVPEKTQGGTQSVSLRVTDSGALLAKQSYSINVVTYDNNTPPQATLDFPKNGVVVDVTNPQLGWTAEDPEGNNIYFDVFLSEDHTLVLTQSNNAKIATKITNYLITPPTPLTKGVTYYWTVEPSDDTAIGICTNGIWSFSVNESAVVSNKPSSVLNSPLDNTTITRLPLQLSWSGTDPDTDELTYDLFVSQEYGLVKDKVETALREKGINVTNYILDDLTVGATYYWTVIPDDGSSKGICQSGVWSFTIKPTVETNRPPAITSKPVTVVYAGETYSYLVLATDPDADSISFSLSTRPLGMIIDTNTGQIYWPTDDSDVGEYKVKVRVSDTHVFVDQSFTLKVLPLSEKNHIPSILSNPKTKATSGEAYKYRIVAKDEDTGDKLNFSLTKAPSGMKISSDGVISWIPKRSGKEIVNISVSDGKDTVYQPFEITVKAAPAFSLGSTYLLLLILLLIVICVVAIAIAAQMRKRSAAARAKAEKAAEIKATSAKRSTGHAEPGMAATAAARPGATTPAPYVEYVEDFRVTEAFLIYHDGRLIINASIDDQVGIDRQLMSGMLVAIQGFVKESFQTQHGLDSFEFGNRKVLLKGGRYVVLAVVVEGPEPGILREEMQSIVTRIETLYAGKVEEWDGNTETFSDAPLHMSSIFHLRSRVKIKEKAKGVRMKSGVEFYSGYVRLKVGVSNELSAPISNINLDLLYDINTLRLSHIEPQYPISDNMIYLPDIQPNEKRSVAIYFDPLICQESHIDGKVRYTDETGTIGETDMKRRPVDVVCPIFYTVETINVAMLKRLLSELSYSDSRVYDVKDGTTLVDAHALAATSVRGHDVKLVREFKEEDPFQVETWFYGEAKESDEKLVIKVSAKASGNMLEIFVASDNLASMTGLLAELGNEFRKKLDESGIDQQNLLLSTDEQLRETLKQTKLLLDKYTEAEADAGETEPKMS